MVDVAGSDLMRRQTSKPLMSGSLTSRMTRSGRADEQLEGLASCLGLSDLETRAKERLRERIALAGIVVDKQDEAIRLPHFS